MTNGLLQHITLKEFTSNNGLKHGDSYDGVSVCGKNLRKDPRVAENDSLCRYVYAIIF